MKSRIISEHDYKVIMLCKNNPENAIEEIKKYLKEEHLLKLNELSMKDIYIELVRVFLYISNVNDVEILLTNNIPQYFTYKYLKSNFQDKTIDYSDLCQILILKLSCLKMKDVQDVYKIEKNSKIMSYEEYDNKFTKLKK